jgi:hypothetical protein
VEAADDGLNFTATQAKERRKGWGRLAVSHHNGRLKAINSATASKPWKTNSLFSFA